MRSILDYGSEIWSYQNDKPGQDVQYHSIRYFLRVHKSAPLLGPQAEMAWLNIVTYLC